MRKLWVALVIATALFAFAPAVRAQEGPDGGDVKKRVEKAKKETTEKLEDLAAQASKSGDGELADQLKEASEAVNEKLSEHVTTLLDPHGLGLVFWQGLTFAVVLFILKKAAWGPILEGLEKRERTIADSIAAAQRERTEAGKLLEEHQKKLAQVKNEGQAIINEAAADAKRVLEEAQAKALAEAEATRQRALRDIEMAKAKAIEELRTKSVDLAMELASKVIGSEVDRTKQRKLVEDFVKQYGKN